MKEFLMSIMPEAMTGGIMAVITWFFSRKQQSVSIEKEREEIRRQIQDRQSDKSKDEIQEVRELIEVYKLTIDDLKKEIAEIREEQKRERESYRQLKSEYKSLKEEFKQYRLKHA